MQAYGLAGAECWHPTTEVHDGNDAMELADWDPWGRLVCMASQGWDDYEAGIDGGSWRSASYHTEVKTTALWLLAAGMSAQFMWKRAPEWAQPDAWNAAVAIFIVMLLCMLAASYRRCSSFVLVCSYLALLWVLTAGCSLLWLKEQWTVLPGQDQCDARFKIPLSVMGLFVGLMVLVSIRSGRGGTDSKY